MPLMSLPEPGGSSEAAVQVEITRHSRHADIVAMCAAAVITGVVLVLGLARPILMPTRLPRALAITTAFALLAWVARGVNASGALAGAAIAFIMTIRDLRFFWMLL